MGGFRAFRLRIMTQAKDLRDQDCRVSGFRTWDSSFGAQGFLAFQEVLVLAVEKPQDGALMISVARLYSLSTCLTSNSEL